MTQRQPALAILLALLGSSAQAGPLAVARAYSVEFFLSGSKDFIAGQSNFFGGRCVGVVEVLDA
jgi:hypothetical protein